MELSCRYGDAGVHLLAYEFDPTVSPLAKQLEQIIAGRNAPGRLEQALVLREGGGVIGQVLSHAEVDDSVVGLIGVVVSNDHPNAFHFKRMKAACGSLSSLLRLRGAASLPIYIN